MTYSHITVISVLLACTLLNQAVAQTKTFYPLLEKGKYDVGYKTSIDFDFSRTYNLRFPDDTSSRRHDPRPIITNIWYPATPTKNAKSMLYGDYIKIQNANTELKTFIKRVEDYNSKNSSFYMFYKKDLDEDMKMKFARQMNIPIHVFKDATPANGKFPLVIYHAGLGGTLNDNTVLCEYLASHGFVVVTGAFQANDYREIDLNWDLERSRKDLDFMMNKIKVHPFIDFSKVAAIGHSYGAQAVLAYRTEDFSPVSWLIIIDTTMDYSFTAEPDGFEPLTTQLYSKIHNLNAPMLVFANPEAIFRVMDSLKYSNRTYCTIDLEHNDFTSLTALSKQNGLLKRAPSDDLVWSKYTLMVNYCLNFLRHHVLNDASARNFLMAEHQYSHVAEVPKGKKLAVKIPEYSDYFHPPTKLQLEQMAFEKNLEILDKAIGLHHDKLSEDDINEVGYSVLKKYTDVAVFIFKKNVEVHPTSWNAWDSLGEAYLVLGNKAEAIKSYEKSIELNPKNDNGVMVLERLKR